jgi:hypothetical protein
MNKQENLALLWMTCLVLEIANVILDLLIKDDNIIFMFVCAYFFCMVFVILLEVKSR